MNYIDVFSRMQLEKLLLEYQPTMLFVEHDGKFCEKVATKVVELKAEISIPKTRKKIDFWE